MAFIDEIFKANSAILNTLLTLLNERLFDNGSQRDKVPLVTLVSSSLPTVGDFRQAQPLHLCLRASLPWRHAVPCRAVP